MLKLFTCLMFVSLNFYFTYGGNVSEDPYPEDVCFQTPGVVGPCKAAIPRFTYDPCKGCIKFTYGGCQGNGNNFMTLEDCEKTCGCYT